MNLGEEVVVDNGLGNEKALPKDAQIMVSILRDIGITEFEPRVINQVHAVHLRCVKVKDQNDTGLLLFNLLAFNKMKKVSKVHLSTFVIWQLLHKITKHSLLHFLVENNEKYILWIYSWKYNEKSSTIKERKYWLVAANNYVVIYIPKSYKLLQIYLT